MSNHSQPAVELPIVQDDRALSPRLARGCAAAGVAVGTLVLVGWVADIAVLKSGSPGLATMKANTAVAILLTSVALGAAAGRRFRVVGVTCSVAALALVAATVAQYLLPIDVGIDQLLFLDEGDSPGTLSPGRMAPATGVILLLLGLSLLLTHAGRAPLLAQALLGAGVLWSLLCCLGYLYGAREFYTFGHFTSVAVHTAVTLLVLCVGAVSAAPAVGPTALLLDRGAGGIFVRRVLPAAVLVPILLAWVRLQGQRAGWFDTEFGLALYALTSATTFAVLVWWTAGQVRQVDARRQRADQTALESEQRYRMLLEGVPQLVWTCDPDGRCDYLSRQWVEYTGVPEAEHLGYGWLEAVHPDDRGSLQASWEQAVRTGQPFDVEFRIRSAGGAYRWFKTRAVRYTQPDGTTKWFGTNTDIQDKKAIEERLRQANALLEQRVAERTAALQESEGRFRSAFEHAPIGMALVAPDGRWLQVNRSLCEMVGYAEADLLATTFQAITHPDDGAADTACVEQLLAGTLKTHQVEKRYFHQRGHVVHVQLSVSLVRDAADEPLYFVAQIKDVSQQKQFEAALAANEALLRHFIKHSPAAIAMFGREMRYVQASDRWISDYQLDEGSLIGRSHYDLFPDLPERWKAVHQRVLAGAVERCDEDPFPQEDGTTVWVQWECRPWFEAGGAVGGLIIFAQVITQRKLVEEQVRASLREKEVLLKEIHHRVKNNLQIVSTLLDLQADYTQDRQALELFQESRGRVRSMALIHDRLYRSQDLARVDFAQYARQLADDLYSAYKVSDDEVALFVEVDVPPLPIDVAIPCGLVLNELVSNCLKHAFRERAGGWIRVTLRGADGTNVLVVADNGVGFPPGLDLRASPSFGLQLVAMLVEQLRGEIDLDRTAGTQVRISFPDHRPGGPTP